MTWARSKTNFVRPADVGGMEVVMIIGSAGV